MKNFTAHLSLFTANLIWACGYPLYKFVLPTYIKPLPLFTATVIFTALLSIGSLLFQDSSKPRERLERGDIWAIVGAALLIAVIRKEMLIFGLSMTSPIDGSIIATISPIVVLVISVVVGLERFSMQRIIGIVLGFWGAIGVILTGSRGSNADTGMLGNLLILICAFISAIYVVWFKSLLRRYSPMFILRWMFCVAAVVSIPIGIKPLLEVDTSGWDHRVWLAVIYLVTMPTYIPNLLLTSGLKRVPPTVASIYTYVQPTFAVLISVAFGLDKLQLATVLFAALIFSGVGIVIASQRRADVL